MGRRIGVPMSAIAIGCMSPDFEFFLHLSPRALFSHTLAGLFIFCVPAGLLVFAAWELVARDPMRALLGMPGGASPSVAPLRWWSGGALGVLAGAATHLLWDGVTHGGYWGAILWPWLREPAFALGATVIPWFNALQHASTLIGGLVVLGWLLRRAVADGQPSLLWRTPWRAQAALLIIALAVVGALANGSRGPFGNDFWTAQRLLGRIAVGGLLGFGFGVLAVAIRHRRAAAPRLGSM